MREAFRFFFFSLVIGALLSDFLLCFFQVAGVVILRFLLLACAFSFIRSLFLQALFFFFLSICSVAPPVFFFLFAAGRWVPASRPFPFQVPPFRVKRIRGYDSLSFPLFHFRFFSVSSPS